MELVDMLPRLRQSIPFPVDLEKLYRAAFPSQIGKWFWERVPSDLQPYNVAYRNLLRITARQEVIHFNLTDPAAIDDWREANPNMPFWVRMENSPVCPSSKMEPFLLSEAVRTDPALQEWYYSADKLDTEIRYFTQKIYAISPLFSNRTDIALAWPEAVQAVPTIISGLRVSTTAMLSKQGPRIHGIRTRINEHLPPVEMARLIEMLATATLLPPKFRLAAWVGTNKEEL